MKKEKIEEELRSSGAIGRVSGITILSRILGLAREQTKAYFLGTGIAAEAFTAAFMIPNLLRRFLSEGIMSAAVVPVLTEYLKDKEKAEVRDFISIILGSLLILLVIVVSAGIFFAPYYVPFLFPRFDTSLTTLLTIIMFPYIGFVSLAALFQSVLNCHGRFSIPAFCPVVLNIIIVGGTWLWWCLWSGDKGQATAARVMSFAVLAGGLAQAAILIPTLLRLKYSLVPRLSFSNPGIIRVSKLVVPVAIGGGVYQVNVIVSLVLAARFKGAAPALNYSNRLLELALGVFVLSVITVSLPGLSRLWHEEKKRYFKQTAFALKLILLVSIPSGIGLLFLRKEIITILFHFGAFGEKSVALTSNVLLFHAASIPLIGGCRFFSQAFYAARDSRTPLKIGIAIAVSNIALCFILIRPLSYCGIALAMTLSMGVGLVLNFMAWKGKNGAGTLHGTGGFAIKVLAAGLLMWLFHYLWTTCLLPFPEEEGEHIAKALHLAGAVFLDSGFYFAAIRLLGIKDLNEFLGVVVRRRRS